MTQKCDSNTVLIKKPHIFCEPQLIQHCEICTPPQQPKTHSLYKFSSKHVYGWCQRKHLHCTISRHSRSSWKANACIFLCISVREFRKFLFQRRRKLLSSGGLNDFFKAARCLDLVKCFKIFHINWIIWKFIYFSAFRYFHQ